MQETRTLVSHSPRVTKVVWKPKRRNLVCVRLGRNSAFERWYRSEQPRTWDLLLNYYMSPPEGALQAEAELIAAGGISKFVTIRDLYSSDPTIFGSYEYIWILDEDIELSFCDVDKFFSEMSEFHLELAQPALTHDSPETFDITKVVGESRLRFTNFVEIRMPCFSQNAFRICVDTFAKSVSGWGIDYVWPKLLSLPSDKVAVVDSVIARRSKDFDTRGAFHAYLRNELGVDPFTEMANVAQQFGIDPYMELRVLGAVPRQNRSFAQVVNRATTGGWPAPRIGDPEVISLIKRNFSPDGGAEQEHNAAAGTLGFGAIHYSLVNNLRPQRALVIGSRYGYVPAIVGLALLANGAGNLDFVDANYSDAVQGFDTSFGGIGHWTGDPRQNFEPFGLSDIIQIHVMRSSNFFQSCEAKYGYIYIDGDHSYEGSRYDFDQAERVAESGALITMHDVLVREEEFGVWRVFAELDSNRYDKILIGAWPGLAVIQIK